MASGAIDGIINVFDVESSKLMHTLEGHAMPIRSLTFSPDSQRLLTGSDDCHIYVVLTFHFLHNTRQKSEINISTHNDSAS